MLKRLVTFIFITAICFSAAIFIASRLEQKVNSTQPKSQQTRMSEVDSLLYAASRARMLNEYNKDTFIAINGGDYMSGREVENNPNHYYIEANNNMVNTNYSVKQDRPINKTGPTEPLPVYKVSPNEYVLSETELQELAKLVYAEDGNQPIESQEAIVDSVLNLRDDPKYPDNIHDIIFTPGLYTVVSNGAYYRAEPSERTWQAIYNELEQFGGRRNSYEVKYFRTSHYHTFGTPLFNIGNIYFSGS